jgi:hypothetical protein
MLNISLLTRGVKAKQACHHRGIAGSRFSRVASEQYKNAKEIASTIGFMPGMTGEWFVSDCQAGT